MGSKGSKPRKSSHSQHLPKVGTPQAMAHEQQAERHAIAENMSFGGRADKSPVNAVVGIVAILLVIGAIGGLILLVAMR